MDCNMEKYTTLIFTLVLLLISGSFSQGANYYVSGLDLPKSLDPLNDMENNFIYRFANGEEKSFYLVKINDLMLKEKSLFRWPKDIEAKAKETSIIAEDSEGRDEILDYIYNEKLILTESKKAFVKIKGKFQKLEKIDYVGVSLIGNEEQSFYLPKSSGGIEKKSGPIFQYSIKNSSTYILVTQKRKVPKWIFPVAKPRQYQVVKEELEELIVMPALKPMPSFEASIDEIKLAYNNQKQIDSLWIDSIKTNLIEFPKRNNKETDAKYKARNEIHEIGISSVINQLTPEGWELERYALYEQRLQTQKLVQQKSEIIDDLSLDKRGLLVDQWWNSRLLLRSRTLLAGHLHEDSYADAPSQLWGQDLLLDFTNDFSFTKNVYWHASLGGGYTSWKTQESTVDASSQFWYGTRLGVKIPVFVSVLSGKAPYSGGGLAIRLGSTARMAHNDIQSVSPETSQELSAGFYTGLDFNFGENGGGFGIEYEYLSDQFGEIGITLHLPLVSWRN